MGLGCVGYASDYHGEVVRVTDVEQKREQIVRYLMAAFNLAVDTLDVYEIGKLIEEAVNKLKVMKQCERCGRKMPAFDYYLKQGICETCAQELSESED